jgi:hypothetical protein
MSILTGEQEAVLIIILTVVILAVALYTSTIHTINQQKSLIARLPNAPQPNRPAAQPPQQPLQQPRVAAIPPPVPSLEELQFERQEHMRSVQSSLERRLQDVDTYFATKQLLENRAMRNQQAQERQRQHAREDFLEWAEKCQAIRMSTFPLPRVDMPPVPPIVERIPFHPMPEEWNPLANHQQQIVIRGQAQGGQYGQRGYQGQGYQGYQLDGSAEESSGYDAHSRVAPMVDSWMDGVSVADTQRTLGSFVHGSQEHANSIGSDSESESTISINSRMSHISI